MERLIRIFVCSCGVLLLITASAKIISSMGSARILGTNDPIAMVPFRYTFLIIGLIELAVALKCFARNRVSLQLWTIFWLSGNFLLYRIGLAVVDYHRPCHCLGSLTDALPLSADIIELFLRATLIYLLVGSSFGIVWLFKMKKKSNIGLISPWV